MFYTSSVFMLNYYFLILFAFYSEYFYYNLNESKILVILFLEYILSIYIRLAIIYLFPYYFS